MKSTLVRISILLFSAIQCYTLFGQLYCSNTRIDFGLLEQNEQPIADFVFQNNGQEDAFIIKVEPFNRDVVYSIESRFVLPDSVSRIRLFYKALKTGAFSEKAKVWVSTSETPIILTLKGVLASVPQVQLQSCPDFSNSNSSSKRTVALNKVYLSVIDDSGRVVSYSNVIFNSSDGKLIELHTSDFGKTGISLEKGLYLMKVRADGYVSKEFEVYFDRKNDSLVVELQKEVTYGQKTIDLSFLDEEVIDVEETEIKTSSEGIVLTDAVVSVDTVEYNELPVSEFLPNNIVFLIDHSVSMKHEEKLEILKEAVTSVVKLLRPMDKLAVVTYASETNLLLPTTYVRDKGSIEEVIRSIEAGGKTYGSKGLKLAYSTLEVGFIENGNNQIFIATDGAFTEETGKFQKEAKRLIRENVHISFIGVKNAKWTEKILVDIAAKSSGTYIHLATFDDANGKLLEEVKKNSRIGGE